MHYVEGVVQIDAPPQDVWRVWMDVERWPEWAPTMRRVERIEAGAFGVGSRARITLKGMPATVWRVTEFKEGRSFTWETESRLRVIARHAVEAEGAGSRVRLSTEATGLLAVLMTPLVLWMSRRNVPQEAEGLKRRCEALGA